MLNSSSGQGVLAIACVISGLELEIKVLDLALVLSGLLLRGQFDVLAGGSAPDGFCANVVGKSQVVSEYLRHFFQGLAHCLTKKDLSTCKSWHS